MTQGMGMETFHAWYKLFHVRIVNCIECGCCDVSLHVYFRWGIALVGKPNYWALLTSSWDPPFRYTRRRRSLEAVSTKKAGLWP